MNEEKMLHYVDRVFRARGPFSVTKKCLLLMDEFTAHTKESVLKALRQMRCKVLFIPAGMTSMLQPLDVAVNSSFKSLLRKQWEEWLAHGPKSFTPRGYRKRPSWQDIVNFVSKATGMLDSSAFKRAFECCGIPSR